MEDNIVVAVSMITYNHENYISEAIEGVLNQKTNFKFKLYITVDNSPDNTVEVCKKYANKYPDIIELENFDKNKGSIGNWFYNLQKCQLANPKYIATCEGDDYWIDPLKLQKQVDFLDNNESYSIVTSKYYTKTGDNNLQEVDNRSFYQKNKLSFELSDYLIRNFTHTSTFLFRSNSILTNVPDWAFKVFAGDQTLMVLVAGNKKVKFLDDYLSVYRLHELSISQQTENTVRYDKYRYFLDNANKYTKYKYKKIFEIKTIINKLAYTTNNSATCKLYKKTKAMFFGNVYLPLYQVFKNT
ncbi:MAG: glycosyltransferase [Ichthyobacteriaceae bacterium]|nr:glycosyltransferase [Ichthyobacteriaceae bacterium]